MNVLRPLSAKLEHFHPFHPCRAKNLTFDLFYNNYETGQTILFWIVITRGICWYVFWQHWNNFWIWPLYKLSCDPRLPVQAVTRQQYEILIFGPIPTKKSPNPLYLYSWVYLASFWPMGKWWSLLPALLYFLPTVFPFLSIRNADLLETLSALKHFLNSRNFFCSPWSVK